MEYYKYKDGALSIADRVTDLLSHMTIDEKMAQMMAVNTDVKDKIVAKADGGFDIEAVKHELRHGIGQVARLSETKGGQSQTADTDATPLTPYENASLSNVLQQFFIEETRLGIPAIFHEEALHGLASAHATSFPQPIAMASTFNTDLVQQAYSLMAKECRLRGAHQVLSPVVDIARDARWGRVEETYGEDTYLATQMGAAAVSGFQGDNTYTDGEHVAATLKHFVGHGHPEGGNNTAPVNYSERVLREYHMAPFKSIIENQGVASIMTTYHEIDGVPAHGNVWLNQTVLREQWGFEGFVVADYYAIREMYQRDGIVAHGVARDAKHACELGIMAGVNIELPDPDCYRHTKALVNEGTIPLATIDKLVGDVLRLKFQLGLFDHPYVDAHKAEAFCGSQANRAIALATALESITLLQNKQSIVPLKVDNMKKIAVIGPNADSMMLGGYSGIPNFETTLLSGIQDYIANVDAPCQVVYAEGCRLTEGGSWSQDEVTFASLATNERLTHEALTVAHDADVILLAVGGNEQTSREAWSLTHLGDRTDLDLIGHQNAMIDALATLKVPMVAFVYNGRPLTFNNLVDKVDAIFECWYLGQEGGIATAKVLFGDCNPSGKLPISFPRSVGHLPVYYNHKPTARRGYLDADVSPLFPFGFGLSYSTFVLNYVTLDHSIIRLHDSFTVQATLANTSPRDGAEVLQVYIRDVQSSVTRAVKELKAFSKVTLKAGETKTVKLHIDNSALAFYDINMDFVVEPGDFLIMVGTSSCNAELNTLRLQVTL